MDAAGNTLWVGHLQYLRRGRAMASQATSQGIILVACTLSTQTQVIFMSIKYDSSETALGFGMISEGFRRAGSQ